MSRDPDRPDGVDALAALIDGAPVLDAAAPLIDGAPILDAAAGARFAARAPIAARPRLGLRVNGARLGDPARPVADAPATSVVPTRRLGFRVGAALSTRPNDYMPDDDNGSGVAS